LKNGSDATPIWRAEWEERKQPKKFDFQHGVCLVAILTKVERIKVRDRKTNERKPVNRYTAQPVSEAGGHPAPEGDPVFFFGSVQIDNVLRPTDAGHLVSITCTGEDKESGRNGNPMKTFQIFVDKNPAPGWADDGTPITDDDFPADSF